MRGRAVLVIALTAVLSVGCGWVPGWSDPPRYDGPPANDLRAEQVWTADVGPRLGDAVVALLPDRVVLTDSKRGVHAVGTDGEPIWQLGPEPVRLSAERDRVYLEFGPTVGAGEDAVIAAAYWWDPCGPGAAEYDRCFRENRLRTREQGVVAFAAATGKPLWRTVLEESRPYSRADAPGPESRSGYRVVATTRAAVAVEQSSATADAELWTAIGIDATNGRPVWQREDTRVDGAVANRVLARAVPPGDRGPGDREPGAGGGIPVLLSTRSGNEVWRCDHPGFWTVGAGPAGLHVDHGYVTVSPKTADVAVDPPSPLAVELETGATTPVGAAGTIGRDASGAFHAYVGGTDQHRIVSTTLPDGEPEAGEHPVASPAAPWAAGGYLWTTRNGDRPVVTATDRTGALRIDPIPGFLKAVDRNWLVTSDDRAAFTVHRLSS